MYIDIMKNLIMEEDLKLQCNQFKSEEMGIGLNFYVEMNTNDVSELTIDVEGDLQFVKNSISLQFV